MFKVWHDVGGYFYFHCDDSIRQYREIATAAKAASQ